MESWLLLSTFALKSIPDKAVQSATGKRQEADTQKHQAEKKEG